MAWLNAEAERNIASIEVTFSVFQLPMSWLNAEADKHNSYQSLSLCPTPNVLVEPEANETYIHRSHLRCVPTSNVLVERRSGHETYESISVTCAVFHFEMSPLNVLLTQSLEEHQFTGSIHSYLPPNSYPNSASSRSYYQMPMSCTRRYLRPLLQINTLQRKRANSQMESG